MPLDPNISILIDALAEHAARQPDFVFLRGDPEQPFPTGTPASLKERVPLPALPAEPGPRSFPPPPSEPVLIRLIGPSSEFYLREFDPDAAGGKGRISVTMEPAEALRFSSWKEAFDFCQQQPSVAPLRRDGQPNRPLEAIPIEIVLYRSEA